MNWITNLVPPKIKAWVKPDVPDNLWKKCQSCEQMIFHRELVKDMYVCRYCGYHMHFPPEERLQNLFDDGVFEKLPTPQFPLDPLSFKDRKRYIDRLKEAKVATNQDEAIISAIGLLYGIETVCSVFNFQFIGGSMGVGVGQSIVEASKLALSKRCPYIIFTASGGARMHEGMLSLMQMPRTVAAINALKKNNIPYIVVMTNPTTGGVSASFAMIGDVHISEPGAVIGFAGARVIKNTINQDLPAGFQTAEYLLKHGMLDMITKRQNMRDSLGKLISMLTKKAV